MTVGAAKVKFLFDQLPRALNAEAPPDPANKVAGAVKEGKPPGAT